jgi:DNA-binding FrmR family transcriptional regulator
MNAGEDETKLLKRLGRMRGQQEGLRRAVEGNAETGTVLQSVKACRGTLEGFIADVLVRGIAYPRPVTPESLHLDETFASGV